MPRLTEKNNEELAVKALAYLNLKAKIKKLEDEMATQRKDLEKGLMQDGKEDSKGHVYLELEHAGRTVVLKHELRLSAKQSPVIQEIVSKKLPADVAEKCLETVTIVRDDAVKGLFAAGDIPEDVMDEMYITSETRAFKVELKK